MENRYCKLLIILILSFTSAMAAPKREDTPESVKTLIKNLESLTSLSDNQRDDAFKILACTKELFACSSVDGINIDSDNRFNSEFYYIGLDPAITSSRYCHRLYSLLYEEKSLKLSHDILYTEVINAPDIGKDEIYFYDTKVKKTCIYNHKETVIWQSFEVAATNGLIDKIEGFDSRPSDWSGGIEGNSNVEPKTKPYTPPIIENGQTEQDLLRLAARYYTAKDYSGAFTTLNNLINKYPRNAEAWFRMALIVKYKTKWSKKVYKDPNKTAIEFMKKASALADRKLKSKADNALYYWEHPNYM